MHNWEALAIGLSRICKSVCTDQERFINFCLSLLQSRLAAVFY